LVVDMGVRLRRVEQVDRNRELVLEAARRVFLAKGYAGASLDAIATEAGFSKGVVYSQFESKGDLFLALLERRIAERAQQNERLAATTHGAAGVAAIVQLGARLSTSEPEWSLLVMEFRIHAARDPELNRRYAAVHAQTVEHLGRTLQQVLNDAGVELPFSSRNMAELMLAIGVGSALERLVNPQALPARVAGQMLNRALGADPLSAGRSAPSRRKRP
jgi:AcrR family transcriptional regulator